MLPYGSKRTYGDCRTKKRYGKKLIRVDIFVKNRKLGRVWDVTQVIEPA